MEVRVTYSRLETATAGVPTAHVTVGEQQEAAMQVICTELLLL